MKLYHVEYVGHWGATVAYLTDSQATLWREHGASLFVLALD